jgi:zinc and cadmium transporter
MPLFFWILAFSFLGSVFCLIGGLFLLWKEKLAKKIVLYLVSFAAGALLGAAFLHLLPEAVEEKGTSMFFYVLVGLLVMFLVEKFLLWYHCHEGECEVHVFSYTILFGDGVHNFIDGIIIGASFLISVPLGIITALAIAFHEIPQEIGDFAVMLHGGMKRMKILIYNFLAALMTPLAAILAYFFASTLENATTSLIAFAAGTFIYIAASDLIPEIHKETKKSKAIVQFFLLFMGILVIWGVEKVLG